MPDVLFDYNPALLSDKDWVRWFIGDTKPDRAEIDDREIAALLAEEAEPEPDLAGNEPTTADWRSYRALVASRAADSIAAKYARESDVSFDNQRVAMSAKYHQYSSLAKRLRAIAQSPGGTGSRWVKVERW